jgi:Tfp pilus assembly protein PilZ
MTEEGTPDDSAKGVTLPFPRTPQGNDSYSPKIFLREKLDDDGDDRREEPRRTYYVGVHLQTQDAEGFGLTGNISSSGLFVVAEDPPPLGSQVTLDFLLADDPELPDSTDSLVVDGEVRWVRPPSDDQPSDDQDPRPPGFGVEFASLDPIQHQRLAELLDQLDTPADVESS